MNWTEGAPPSIEAGMQIEVAGKRYLVGHVNVNGGMCNCCYVLGQGEAIARYRVLLTPEQMEAA